MRSQIRMFSHGSPFLALCFIVPILPPPAANSEAKPPRFSSCLFCLSDSFFQAGWKSGAFLRGMENSMSSSKEPVCGRFQELRRRLDRLRTSCSSQTAAAQAAGWLSFQQDWQEGWSRIAGLRAEIDQMLNRSGRDIGQPAILRFPPAEEGGHLDGRVLRTEGARKEGRPWPRTASDAVVRR